MRVFRVLIDMTRQAAAATIPHNIVTVLGFCLSDMATGTLLAQHRVRNTVPERLKIDRLVRADATVQQLSCNPDDASAVVHKIVRHRRNAIAMTASAAALRVGQFAGKSKHSIVCAVLGGCFVIAGMAANAIYGGKRMCRAKPILFVRMTKQAGVFCRLLGLGARHKLQRHGYNGEQAEVWQQSWKHDGHSNRASIYF